MSVVVGYIKSPEGRTALQRAVAGARLRDLPLTVVHSLRHDARIREAGDMGKLVLGSNAQDVLLGADCPELAVKAPEDGERRPT